MSLMNSMLNSFLNGFGWANCCWALVVEGVDEKTALLWARCWRTAWKSLLLMSLLQMSSSNSSCCKLLLQTAPSWWAWWINFCQWICCHELVVRCLLSMSSISCSCCCHCWFATDVVVHWCCASCRCCCPSCRCHPLRWSWEWTARWQDEELKDSNSWRLMMMKIQKSLLNHSLLLIL